MYCSNCGHAEADHETVEYRGDKSRACVNAPGCRCRDFRKVKPTEALTRETVTIMKATKIAGVSRRTIYNWLADGKVAGVRTAGGTIRIFADTLFKDIGTLPNKQTPPPPKKTYL